MEPQGTLSLENLILTGSFNQNDFTFPRLSEFKCSEYEKGFPISSFVQNVPDVDDITFEFKRLDKLTANQKVIELLNDDEDVKQFNRYSDILPYRHNTVALPAENSKSNTYINASYVSSSIKGDDKSFIVCQSPIEKTVADFWKMVINENVHTIVMLCKLKAGSRQQSCEYWPEIKEADFAGFKHVSLKEKIQKAHQLVERHFVIKSADGSSREVVHYQWEGWPDHGVPNDEERHVLEELVDRIDERRKLGKGPVIVHCSAGIGRSGTLVALHNIRQIINAYKTSNNTELKKQAHLSVFSVVRRLRLQRFGMVQTPQQYELIYKLVAEILQRK